MWSIGVILYIMLGGQPPFGGSDKQIMKAVERGIWEFKGVIWDSISEEAKDLVSKLMEKDVKVRISAVDALAHPWFEMMVKKKFDKKLATKAIAGLSNFRNESKLKQATLTFMAGHLATKKQQKELRSTFAQFDENGDGLIQRNEFLVAYRTLYPNHDQAEVDERANEVFDNADADGNGDLDFGEWCTASINQTELLNEPNMRAAFRLFDKDNGGTIDATEIAAILGHNITQERDVWDEVIREVDVNGDGQIDFEEFTMMMKKLAEKDLPQEPDQ